MAPSKEWNDFVEESKIRAAIAGVETVEYPPIKDIEEVEKEKPKDSATPYTDFMTDFILGRATTNISAGEFIHINQLDTVTPKSVPPGEGKRHFTPIPFTPSDPFGFVGGAIIPAMDPVTITISNDVSGNAYGDSIKPKSKKDKPKISNEDREQLKQLSDAIRNKYESN
jgi:hypothetical protein